MNSKDKPGPQATSYADEERWTDLEKAAKELRRQAARLTAAVASRRPLNAALAIGNLKCDSETAYGIVMEFGEFSDAKDACTRDAMDTHMQQVITERLNLGHLYAIEDGEAYCKPAAASSVWRLVREEVERAGWRLIPRGRFVS
jgi:hypothetical protein